ncbi:flagella synthesis protein FlgN [Thiomonas intermedia]|uniref:flagella synthesis protein FlgN n=1 Tax=Thiomonas intermedia TaxID=926 RepID=UPI0009A52343|nr:flagellar protein FlgN [Thiomonas intermedia]
MPQTVDDLLRHQLDRLQALDRLLAEEHACLLKAAADQLPALTERKNALMAELETLERERVIAFADTAGATTRAAWASVQTMARQVAEANQRNGVMIAALVRSTEGALQILRGDPDGVDLYGSHGQGQSGSGSARLLVSA